MSKYYAVIRGRKPGVYGSWEECKLQTDKFTGSLYKSYGTKKEAEEAFARKSIDENIEDDEVKELTYEGNSISVDGSTRNNTGLTEYQGVRTDTGEKLFGSKLYKSGTNNLAEFIALVVGIRYLDKKGLNIPIYTDSMTAMAWLRNKKVNTDLKVNEDTKEILEDVKVAEGYIKGVDIGKYDVRKWETKDWGESKADFGRK